MSDANPYQAPQTVWERERQPFDWQLEAHIDTQLGPAERIVWQGRPVVPWPVLLILSLVLATVGTLPLLAVWPDGLWAVARWVGSFITTLCYGAAGTYWTARHTAFVLTDQRIVTCAVLFNRYQVRTYLPEELAWKPPKTVGQPARLRMLRYVAEWPKVQSLATSTLLPQLALRLRDPDPAVRRRAARSFAALGAAAAPFTGDLLAASRSDDAIVRRFAAEALGNSGVVTVAAALRKLRFDDDRRVAAMATKALNVLSRSSGGHGNMTCQPHVPVPIP